MDRSTERRRGTLKDTQDVALDKIGNCVLLPSDTNLLPVETTPHPRSDQDTQGLHTPPCFPKISHMQPFPAQTAAIPSPGVGRLSPFLLSWNLGQISRAKDKQCLVPHTPERTSKGCRQPGPAAELAYSHSSPLSRL